MDGISRTLAQQVSSTHMAIESNQGFVRDALDKLRKLEKLIERLPRIDDLEPDSGSPAVADLADILDSNCVSDDYVFSRLNMMLAPFLINMDSGFAETFKNGLYKFVTSNADRIRLVETFLSLESRKIYLRQLVIFLIASMRYIEITNTILADPNSETRKVIELVDWLLAFRFPENVIELDNNSHYRFPEFLSPGSVALDCGAFIGDTAEIMDGLVGKDGKVFSFEPFRESYEKCLALNLGNTMFVNSGVGNINGSISFATFDENPAANSVISTGGTQISVVRLDDFIRNQKSERVDFVKMDVEGSELDALKGAHQIISDFHPVLAISIYHRGGLDLVDVPYYLCTTYGDIYNFSLLQGSIGCAETVMFAVPKQNL